ncbi:hypothetical protein Ahy_A07g032072 [Arachis hypogaea]|uniref:PB1-like domain-containing protein n=1 Tax=Arachis hypogaea TaxID=3818 RepID=A0A445C605_ARAHY|nr:hypothetical protein Ahy_A07g032072 [Arachis hypogaea]
MDNDITIFIHHEGSFETKEDGEVVYVRDQIEHLFRLEEDTLDVFSIRNYYKILGYDNLKECWRLAPGMPLKTGLRALSHNKELLKMCFHAKNNEGVVHVYLEYGNFEHEGDEVPQLVPITSNPKTLVSDTIANPSSCIPNTPLEQNTITFPETNFAPPDQPNSASPTQPNFEPQTQPTSNHLVQPTSEPLAQPKSKHSAQTNSSPAAQSTSDPTPQSTTSTPPSQPKSMPLFRPCSFKPKTNKSEKSIPTTTTKKSATSVKKNSKSTPREGAVKKCHSYESAEDELYRPRPKTFDNSSDDDSDSEVAAARTRELKIKKNKAKGKICLEDLCEEDELIVQNSDEEVDLGQVIEKVSEVQPPYDAFDAYHDDFDEND